MFVRTSSRRIVNTEHIVEIEIIEARPERTEFDEEDYVERTYPARPTKIEIITDAVVSRYDDGGDYPEFRHAIVEAHAIVLVGEEAELFLTALPVYTPVLEGGAM